MADPQLPPSREHGPRLATWTFPSFVQHERTTGWFVVAGTIAVACIVFAFFDKNYLFPIIILLVGAILFQQTRREPEEVIFSIYGDGIELLGQNFYPYNEIKNFWILYQPPHAKYVYFRFGVGVRNNLRVPLDSENPLKVREVLSQFLQEDFTQETEPTVDALGRMLKL